MFVNTVFRRVLFTCLFLVVSLYILFMIFYPLYTSSNITINLPSGPFNICPKHSDLWEKLKILYLIFFVVSNFIYSNLIYPLLFNKNNTKIPKSQKTQMQDLHLNIMNNSTSTPLIIPKEGLYQNILITGTIRYRKNKFCYVPIYKAINRFQI